MHTRPDALIAALLMTGACLLAPAAQAESADCAAAMDQSSLNQCAYDLWQVQDAALNAAYSTANALMKQVDADLPESQRGAHKALQDAQRAWIVFRDQTCTAEGYAMHGGNAEPLLVYGCKAQLSEQRALQLTQMIETFGGQ